MSRKNQAKEISMAKKTSKHAPLPWSASGRQCIQDDMAVANCFGEDPSANAEFIVRSVNSNPALVEACKRAVTAIQAGAELDGEEAEEVLEILEKALKQA